VELGVGEGPGVTRVARGGNVIVGRGVSVGSGVLTMNGVSVSTGGLVTVGVQVGGKSDFGVGVMVGVLAWAALRPPANGPARPGTKNTLV